MKLSKAFPWVVVGLLVATLVFLAPQLRADGDPPSGSFARPAPAAPINKSAGVLPAGTVVEPVVIQRPVDDGKPGSSAGLALTTSAPAQAELQAAPELTTDDLKASGIEAP